MRVLRLAALGRSRILAALAGIATLASCESSVVGVERAGFGVSERQLATDALTEGEPSAPTMLVLRRYALVDVWEDAPHRALAELERLASATAERDVVCALAELAFLAGGEEDDRDLYLASACYAWFGLFDTSLDAALSPFDPRFRRCCDLYNRAIVEALRTDDGLQVAPGRRQVLGSSVELAVDLRGVRFDLTRLTVMLPAADYEIEGLANRQRVPGLGAALIVAPPASDEGASVTEYLTLSRCAVASCLLRLDGGVRELAEGRLSGTLELHQPVVRTEVEVGGQRVPLEYDVSAAIAWFVQDSGLLDLELPGLLGGRDVEDFTGLYAFQPHQHGSVPVVFVHGTSSSLARWAGLVNDLYADPALRHRIQVWFYTYQSGQAVAVSADRLRTALTEARARLDPAGTDPALDHMVVIGHSQGGLLARMLVADDADGALWNSVFAKPLAALDLKPETQELAKRIFFSRPLPFVTRAIYVATPHGGSFQADRWYARIGTRLITLPERVADASLDLLVRNRGALQKGVERRVPISIEGMRSDNPFLLALQGLPAAAGVHQHCIVAIDGDDDPPEGDDGVVAYPSAALSSAESTLVVRDVHSCQSNPHVVNEVRRILRAHLAELDAGAAVSAPVDR